MQVVDGRRDQLAQAPERQGLLEGRVLDRALAVEVVLVRLPEHDGEQQPAQRPQRAERVEVAERVDAEPGLDVREEAHAEDVADAEGRAHAHHEPLARRQALREDVDHGGGQQRAAEQHGLLGDERRLRGDGRWLLAAHRAVAARRSVLEAAPDCAIKVG